MNLELHHFFILVTPGEKIAERLSSIGLQEGTRNTHAGQGTSNRRFNFPNGTLELLWVHDKKEALNGPGREMYLSERSNEKTASPFGVILNRKDHQTVDMPFEGWKYQPVYFQPPRAFHIGANSRNLMEPLCVYMPFIEPGKTTENKDNTSFGPISKIKIYTPANPISDVLAITGKADRVSIIHGKKHLMELTLNQNKQGYTKDLRPDLPLIIHW